MNQTAFSQLKLTERASAPEIATGLAAVYFKGDGYLYAKNDAGEEVQITGPDGLAASGGGSGGGIREFQFSPAQFLRGEEPLIESGGELYLQWEQDSDAIYWTPWLRLPTEFEDAISPSRKLLLELGLGAAGTGTATVLALAEYWMDRRKVTPVLVPEVSKQWTRQGYANSFVFVEWLNPSSLTVNGGSTEHIAVLGFSLNAAQGTEFPANAFTLRLSTLWAGGSVATVAVYPTDNATIPSTEAHWNEIIEDRATYEDVSFPFNEAPEVIDVDITTLVQSIVNRSGWAVGNTIELIVYGPESSGIVFSSSDGWEILTEEAEWGPIEPIAGPQQVIQEGVEGLLLDPDYTTLSPLELAPTFAAGDNVKQTRSAAWPGWTPGVGDWEFANQTWVRFRLARAPEQMSQPLKLHYARVLTGPVPTYGYGYGYGE